MELVSKLNVYDLHAKLVYSESPKKTDFNCNANYIDKCWCVKIKVIEGTLEKIN